MSLTFGLALAQPLHRGREYQRVGFAEDFRNARGEGAALHGRQQLALGEARGVVAGEPVVGLAWQVVAHPAPVHEVEGLGVGPEAEDFAHVDLAGRVHG